MVELSSTNDLLILNKLLKSIEEDTSTTDEKKDDFLINLFASVERELTCNQTVLFTYLLYHASDGGTSSGHSYIKNVVNIYERYLSITDVRSKWKTFLTNDVKIKIIEILSKKSLNFVRHILPSISNIFELTDADIRPYLRRTLSTMALQPEDNGFFFWCNYFEIYDSIGFHIYTLFILKKKITMGESNKVIEFFDKINEEKRNKIINFLDKLMPINVPFNKYSEMFYKKLRYLANKYSTQYKYLENIHEIFELRIIEKFISNIVKRFDVSKEAVMNTCIYKMMYRLLFQYVVYKKGIKNGESSTAFVNFYQHVLSDLDHCPDAFQTFIETFCDMKYGEEICFFTIFFMPKLEEYIGDKSKLFLCEESVTLNYKMKFNYLIETNVCIGELYNRTRQKTIITEKLEPVTNIFNNINVYLVENEKHFKEAMGWLYDAELIAVDTEFLPDIVGGGLCLCQIALSNGVLIFDAKKISVKKDCWKELINFLFANSTCPILFFDYKNDYKVLKKIVTNTDEKYHENSFKHIIDIQFLYINSLKEPLFKQFLENNPTADIDKVSLKEITKNVIGIDMDKEFQFAPWRMRPLSIDMIKYAAIDAFILILIYRKIKQIIKNDELFAKLEDVNKEVMVNKTPTVNGGVSKNFETKKKTKERSTITEIVQFLKNKSEIQSHKNTPKDFLLYVDSMILNLQPILLNLGFNINTKEVKNYGALRNVNTTILSVGKAVNQWKVNNRYNRIVSLKYTDSLEDKILFIFNELKVRLDEKLISQKCINCQSNDNVIVSRALLLFMYYDDFFKDSENHKNFPCLEEVNKENLQKDLVEEKEIGFYNLNEEMYYSNGFVIDVKSKKIMLHSEGKWKDLPQQKQNVFLKIYFTQNNFMFCCNCSTFSAYHKI